MNSAIGNFDNETKRVNLSIHEHNHSEIDWCKSKILSLEDEIKRLATNAIVDNTSVGSVQVDALNYVSKEEWDHFAMLVNLMLANGATLYELQQRLMGMG